MHTALSGLTIVEIPSGVATRYCGRLFAAHGATVLQLGEPAAQAIGFGGAGSDAYARWLDAGKRRIASLADAPKADLVIAGQTPAEVAAIAAAMREASLDDAIRLGLTWFADDGPYRNWVGSDGVIQALSGVAYATGAKDGNPMLPRGHAPQVIGGATAFIVALAAILGKENGWRGDRIDVNIFEANLCLAESGVAGAALTGERTIRRGVNRFTPTFPGGIYQASDGWIGITALTPPQWRSLCDLIGHPELAKNPAHLVSLQRMNDADDLDKVLVPAFKTRPKAFWLEEGQRRRIPMAPVPDLKELPATPHWRQRGSFAPVEGVANATGPAMPFHATQLPPVERERTAAKAARQWPLQGIRVLDLTMGWAGPLAARHFADLGADVVKVESCTHFDWWRGFDGSMEGDPPPYEIKPSFLMVNRNKRGITLDLTRARRARRSRDRELRAGRPRQARARGQNADGGEAGSDLRADGRVRRERPVVEFPRLRLHGRTGVRPALRQWRGRRSADDAARRLWRSDRRALRHDRQPDRALSARQDQCRRGYRSRSGGMPVPALRRRCRGAVGAG
jgi:crotonobetainyl-CoA:carnitine CoA-transferase CaiB-like acyl-CoA transferase